MDEAGDRIGRFSIGCGLVALGGFVVVLYCAAAAARLAPGATPADLARRVLRDLRESADVLALLVGCGLVGALGLYLMWRAAVGHPERPSPE